MLIRPALLLFQVLRSLNRPINNEVDNFTTKVKDKTSDFIKIKILINIPKYLYVYYFDFNLCI